MCRCCCKAPVYIAVIKWRLCVSVVVDDKGLRHDSKIYRCCKAIVFAAVQQPAAAVAGYQKFRNKCKMLLLGHCLYTLSPCRQWASCCCWCSWWCCCKQLSKLHLMNSWRPAVVLLIEGWGILHCKKKLLTFLSPAGMSLTKLSLVWIY